MTKEKYYIEAIRYMDNAKDCLKKAKKEGKYYNDVKYVKMACGTAYSGVLVALDCFFIMKGIHKSTGKGRKSIDYYRDNLSNRDKKLLKLVNTVYNILHLSGYYDGTDKVDVIQSGFEDAYAIIEQIKPAGINGTTRNTEPAKAAKAALAKRKS